MRKRCTNIGNLAEIILNNTATITKIEMQSDSYMIEEVPVKDFKRDLILFAQSGIFRDAVEWRYITDDETIMVSAIISPSTGSELRIYMKSDEQTVQVLSKTVFS